MNILFVLGRPNPFPGAAWTRIGFLAEDWSKKGHTIDVLGAFSFSILLFLTKMYKTKFHCHLKPNKDR